MSRTEAFFDALDRRGFEPLLAKATGTVRFEIVRGLCTQHWYVRVDNGAIRVSRENMEADGVVRAGWELFDRIAGGGQNLMTALLRGEMSAEGDIALLVLLERLFPGPHASAERWLATSGG
ncbi:SCP2 sterol-binding domain-containing protein [Micromonospora sp. WMMD812]|uniref:SCP2 sterol-binding domain-containing protein n=1 Tax=Micromonospora sp. WMMD812 TaxID=3015152 RepID=UPI00248CAD19|nr:SCP2 sterol-binding domain-containing protein [Micromonospora sp. WMMD812]WBB70062.1 SCP2 sterol-binding domain-containing protein [Micromonospora sp. WMMD812]